MALERETTPLVLPVFDMEELLKQVDASWRIPETVELKVGKIWAIQVGMIVSDWIDFLERVERGEKALNALARVGTFRAGSNNDPNGEISAFLLFDKVCQGRLTPKPILEGSKRAFRALLDGKEREKMKSYDDLKARELVNSFIKYFLAAS